MTPMPGAAIDGSERVKPVALEGRHVRLEPLTLSHVRGLLEVASGPRETFGYTRVPADLDAMIRYVETALAEQAALRAAPFATVDRGNGKVVGTTRFGNIEFWPWPSGNANQLRSAGKRSPRYRSR